jgi:hypothetical protein
VVSVGNAHAPVGGEGWVDILISSTTGTDTLSNFQGYITITSSGSSASPLLVSATVDSRYIFDGNSMNALYGLSMYSLDSLAPNSITIGDQTQGTLEGGSSDNVTVSSSGNELLARLVFSVPATASVGDVYEVSLADSPTSQFQTNLWESAEDVSFTSGSLGTVTAVAAVPEPATIVAMFTGGACFAGLMCFRALHRRRKTDRQEPEPYFDESGCLTQPLRFIRNSIDRPAGFVGRTKSVR